MGYFYDILRLSELSRADSDYGLQVEMQDCPYRFERIIRTGTEAHKQKTCAVIFRKEDTLYVTFRGTNVAKREHWLRNFNVQLDPLAEGYAHRGFHQTLFWPTHPEYDANSRPLLEVVQESLAALVSQHPECNKLVLSGHSAGGAMAQIYAVEYLEKPSAPSLKLDALYTFASPRALTTDLSERLKHYFKERGNLHCLRFVHPQDVVPQYPMKNTFFWGGKPLQYRHVGKPVLLLPNLDILAPESVTQYQKKHGVEAEFLDGTLTHVDSRVAPHHLDHYLEVIGALAEREQGISHYWRDSVVPNHRRLLDLREKDEKNMWKLEAGKQSDPFLG